MYSFRDWCGERERERERFGNFRRLDIRGAYRTIGRSLTIFDRLNIVISIFLICSLSYILTI